MHDPLPPESAPPVDAPRASASVRAPYAAPTLQPLGSAAALTNAVMMRGLMDGFMQRRTG